MSGRHLFHDERIYRYEVPVDDRWHHIDLLGDPLAVACRDVGVVEFWARWSPSDLHVKRTFMVVGTGQIMPSEVRHWGTVLSPDGGLVWHLLERWPS